MSSDTTSSEPLDIMLSIVCVVKDDFDSIEKSLSSIIESVKNLCNDFEVVLVDNASLDGTSEKLQKIIREDSFPNTQVYVLAHEVDKDIATWAGLEGSIGDYILIFDPSRDTLKPLEDMLEEALKDADVVYAKNTAKSQMTLSYRITTSIFDSLYSFIHGVKLNANAPSLKLVNRMVLNNILRNANPDLAYRHLPLTKGYKRSNLEYQAEVGSKHQHDSFMQYLDRGIRLLITTKKGPIRLISLMSLFGAGFNLLYSFYVLLIAMFKEDVAPGWVTLSMQQASMFFLVFLVFLVFGEYVAHLISLQDRTGRYSVANEYFSSILTRRSKLNVLNQSND